MRTVACANFLFVLKISCGSLSWKELKKIVILYLVQNKTSADDVQRIRTVTPFQLMHKS